MREIPHTDGKYQIARDGRVWSCIRNRFLKTQKDHAGYPCITLGGKTYKIHRLLADAYVPKVPKKDCVNHRNGKRDDNRLENLEWCTQKENVRHAWRTGLCKAKFGDKHHNAKLSYEEVAKIRDKIDNKYGTLTRLAKQYEVSPSLIFLIKRGHREYA